MKRVFLALIATGILAKLLASGAEKLMPQTRVYFEKEPLHKILTLFSNREKAGETAKLVKPVVSFVLPKASLHGHQVNKLAKPINQITPTSAKAVATTKAIENEKAEAERRKKRRKRLEQVVNTDKGEKHNRPQFVPYKVGIKLLKDNENLAPTGSVFVSQEDNRKKIPEEKPSPIVIKQSIDILAWQNLLLKDPSPAQFKPFLSLYKQGQITKAQYYSVLKALQKSAISAARNLAILGASVEPSVEAFQLLATSVYTEQDKNIQTLAIQRLSLYAKSEYVALMTQAFSGGDSQSKLAATQGMGQVVQLLKSNPKALTPQLRQQLLSFASGLTAFLRSTVEASTTAALWATARQTLADVNLVLGMS